MDRCPTPQPRYTRWEGMLGAVGRQGGAHKVEGRVGAAVQVRAQALLQVLGGDRPVHVHGLGPPRAPVQARQVQRRPVPHLQPSDKTMS